ncbi:MAG: hypothetical protein JKZ03_03430 [Flavobacteriaceae bacterium]|nr:hypothetical protein [Flavobacteriaceae bacterium]
MKHLKYLWLILLLPLLAFTAHKFYVSITKIEYAPQEEAVQIITKIFVDDFQHLLQKRYDVALVLDEKDESKLADGYIEKYLLQKIKIEINGEVAHLNYLGKEYDKDLLLCYIEIEGVKTLNSIYIENKVLMDMYDEQQNIIHVKVQGKRRSLILERGNANGMLKFN